MTAGELLHMIQPQQHIGSYRGPIGRLRLDSRNVGKNDVFIALRGTVSDGHRFIRDAVRKGARVVLCEHLPDEVPDEVLWMQVPDTRGILGYLAQALSGSPARAMKMVGVTGTNGKTTVCTLVYQVLRKLGYNVGLLGTVETRIGDRVHESRLTTPDAVSLAETLEQMAALDTAFAIMEVSSHALEQQRVNGIRFDVAAFTNISQDHLDYHRDMESYVEAKKRLFTMLDDRAVAVVNRDDPESYKITDGCRADIWDFRFLADRDFRILDEGPDGLVLDLDGTIVSTPLTGRYNAWNVAQAYLICQALGVTRKSTAAALSEAQAAPGRFERIMPHPEAAIHPISAPKVFVDYAHTPDALENVLKALAAVRGEGDTVHVVFGAGGDRDPSKRPLMGRLADKHADVVTLTSDNPRTEDPAAIIRDIRTGMTRNDRLFVESNRRKAIRSAILEADTRTMVLVAGKGHERYQEVHGRRHTCDDRAIAAKALTEWIERRVHKKGRRSEKQTGLPGERSTAKPRNPGNGSQNTKEAN